MLVEYVATLYYYNSWANARILQAAENLSNEQFVAPTPIGCGSLRGTLVHILSTEWSWRSRWQGKAATTMLREEDFPTLEVLCARWSREERQMQAFLAALSNEDAQRLVQYTTPYGEKRTAPLWQIMTHVVNHGTQHRSEAAAIESMLGYSPGELDLLEFLHG
jgi:uncharacterized damage-inducible protein DinB